MWYLFVSITIDIKQANKNTSLDYFFHDTDQMIAFLSIADWSKSISWSFEYLLMIFWASWKYVSPFLFQMIIYQYKNSICISLCLSIIVYLFIFYPLLSLCLLLTFIGKLITNWWAIGFDLYTHSVSSILRRIVLWFCLCHIKV